MPSFAPGTLGALQQIRAELAGVRADAESAALVLRSARAEAQGLAADAESSRSSFLELARTTSEQASAVEAQVGRVEAAGLRMAAASAQVTSSATAAVQSVESAGRQIEASTEKLLVETATRLDDLVARLQETGNEWDKALLAQIESVKLGITDVHELLRLFGDAVIDGQRLRELLDGLDFRQPQRALQELISGLHDGTVELSSVLEFLGKQHLAVATRLKNMIELFLQGKVTLQAVSDLARQFQDAFPDTDFARLTEAILDALAEGRV